MGIGLEIPVFGGDAASRAVELGASRIELNAAGSYPDGGLTPSLEDLRHVADIAVPLRIMIRPRGPPSDPRMHDFIYSDGEFEEMEAAIQRFKDTGLLNEARGDGFVFGILNEESQPANEPSTHRRKCWIDKDRCSRLVLAARPFKVVFHRAFDEIVSCDDDKPGIYDRLGWSTGLDDLSTCGFNAILTSGGLGHAIQNSAMLDRIITRAETLGIEIIVGGGVRRHNIAELSHQLRLKERAQSAYVHSACLSNTASERVDAEEVTGILSQLS
ncbi:hypothetical protein F5Y04DRAFT_167763 [Hypomontagnella monticulosa]|nr:hypothetical protein F5Y04DRAFT_167763 [Hypomontagnella monticulosa]